MNGNYPLTVGSGVRYHNGPLRTENMFINPELKEEVGFLCSEYTMGDVGVVRHEVGTCFFVTVQDETKKFGFGYLVTARHVWDNYISTSSSSYVRLNKYSGPGVSYIPIPTERSNWRFHDDPSVDLAVLPWRGDEKNHDFTCASFNFAEILSTREHLNSQNVNWPPLEGEDIIYMGLMAQHTGIERNTPIVRRGHVACATNDLINGVYGPSGYIIVELQAYPGQSGGPVWYANDKTRTLYLMGILVAGFPEKQEVFNRKSPSELEVIEYFNLGVSLVTPVSKLIQLLESPTMKEERNNMTTKPIRAFPVSTLPPKKQTDAPEMSEDDFKDALGKVSQRLPNRPSEPESEKK